MFPSNTALHIQCTYVTLIIVNFLGNGTVGVITRNYPVISGMNEKIQCTGWQDETNTLKKEYNE